MGVNRRLRRVVLSCVVRGCRSLQAPVGVWQQDRVLPNRALPTQRRSQREPVIPPREAAVLVRKRAGLRAQALLKRAGSNAACRDRYRDASEVARGPVWRQTSAALRNVGSVLGGRTKGAVAHKNEQRLQSACLEGINPHLSNVPLFSPRSSYENTRTNYGMRGPCSRAGEQVLSNLDQV